MREDGGVNGTRLRLYIAIVLAVGTFVSLAPTATGITLHEWVGLLLIVPVVIHLVVDWEWIVAVTKRFLRGQSGRNRFNYVLDWLLFALTLVVWVSGVLISEAALPSVGVRVSIDTFWTTVHIFSTRLLMVAVGVHVAMHGKWIVHALTRATARARAATRAPGRAPAGLRASLSPVVIITATAALGSIALIAWPGSVDPEWVDGIRAAGREASEAARLRYGKTETAITDMMWICIIIGVPALITLSVLGVRGMFKRRVVRGRTASDVGIG